MAENTKIDAASPQNAASKSLTRQFELAVYDIDFNEMTGKDDLKPVRLEKPYIIEASSPEELKQIMNQFKLCGQVAKIVRELTPPNAVQQMNQMQVQQQAQTQQVVKCAHSQAKQVAKIETKPQYYTVNGIQLKNENGKIYQKQWIPLNIAESSNFRVVNASSNKPVNLNGKRIEMKRWQLVESVDADSSCTIEKELEDEQ